MCILFSIDPLIDAEDNFVKKIRTARRGGGDPLSPDFSLAEDNFVEKVGDSEVGEVEIRRESEKKVESREVERLGEG